jgi:ribosome-associated heat shock protein Hsp15
MARGRGAARDAEAPDRLRLDRWLWHARMARTREAAQSLVEGGNVRVNGTKFRDPAKFIRVGDVLTVALERGTLVLRVLVLPARREAFAIARACYAILSGPAEDAEA